MTSTNLALGTSNVAEIVRSLDPETVVLLDKALTTRVEADKATVSALKKVGLNLVVLSSEALYTLQNSVITKIWAREQHALNVISDP